MGGNLRHKELRGVARIAWILLGILYIGHALDILIARDTYGLAKVERVYPTLVVHYHHDVVRRLIVNQNTTLAIEYQSARGVLYVLTKGI